MKESRTSKVLRASFRSKNTDTGGYIGSHMRISNNKLRENMNNESKLRNEIQMIIKKMIEQNKSVEEIKETLNQDKYKSYEQYLERWIQDWIMKLNPSIKSIIAKGLNRNSQEQEMISLIEQTDTELYKLYEKQIKDKIRIEIQARELGKKREESKKQEEER